MTCFYYYSCNLVISDVLAALAELLLEEKEQ